MPRPPPTTRPDTPETTPCTFAAALRTRRALHAFHKCAQTDQIPESVRGAAHRVSPGRPAPPVDAAPSRENGAFRGARRHPCNLTFAVSRAPQRTQAKRVLLIGAGSRTRG